MNLENIVQLVLSVAGTFNPTLLIALFAICFIGEFHLSIPYLLETIWLLSGYHVVTGDLSPLRLGLLWLAAQAGRQSGAIALFYITRLGSVPLGRMYQKRFGPRLAEGSSSDAMPLRLWRRISYLSPLSVAIGRLLWLRIPLTLALGVHRRLRPLWLGVLLSALVWDGIYIALGILGGHTALTRNQMLLYSVAGLTGFYLVPLFTRLLRRRFSRSRARS